PVRDLPRQTVVIPVDEPGPNDDYAAAYARRILAREIRLVHFADAGTSVEDVLMKWQHLGLPIDLLIKRHHIPTEIRDHVPKLRDAAGEETLVNVVIPETVRSQRWRRLLHAIHIRPLTSS